jgi:hypothetical protein
MNRQGEEELHNFEEIEKRNILFIESLSVMTNFPLHLMISFSQ